MEKPELLRLLSLVLHNTDMKPEPFDFPRCISQAAPHGVANMIYFAAAKLPENLQPDAKIQKTLTALFYNGLTRDTIQNREMDELQEQFEKRKISMLPLKGYVIKNLYPESCMRTMSDTDILIRADQALQAKNIFEELGFSFCGSNGSGNTDFYVSSAQMQYEVHKDLEPEGARSEDRNFLKNLLSYGEPLPGKQCILRLPAEEHYIYILCHFIKHFLGHGIGIRQVMDVYLCRTQWNFDEQKLNTLLETMHLRIFSEHLERLARFWFEDGEPDEMTEPLGDYIFNSGVFGNMENWVPNHMLKVQSQKKNYTMDRLFPSYATMCFYYPSLKKAPVLLPICWCRRIFRAVFHGRKKLARELSAARNTDEEVLKERASFYQNCGLDVFENYRKGQKK